ncbi:MAG: sulfatase [Planctomycetota bacterium]|nr:sulfatase [Planctomycetota bacterium]
MLSLHLILITTPLLNAPQIEIEQPNILLIMADDMGYGDLSCYGSKQIQTPNIDSLASTGVRFTNGYVSSSVCSPSRAGLITGRSGSRFGYEHNLHLARNVSPEYVGIPINETLMPQYLKPLGYRTGLIGKWHLGKSIPEHHPNQRGFDYFFGMLGGSHQYWPTADKNSLERNGVKIDEITNPYLTDWFTDEAINFIDQPQTEPWFLFLSYNTPHSPLQAKESDLEKYAHIQNPRRKKYCAMQACLDQNIGRVIDKLKANGELQNTLIIFLSDNGGSVEVSHAVNAPLRGGKGTFLEGGLRVPFIISWPQNLKPQEYHQPIIATDILATVVAAAGGRLPSVGVKLDSVNLLPYLNGQKQNQSPHQRLYWRMTLRASAIREGDWKLLRPNSEFPQLYNLKEDISELTNLITKHPDKANDLLQKLNAWEYGLKQNPSIISTPNWSKYNSKLYARDYLLKQPEADDPSDYWNLAKNRH